MVNIEPLTPGQITVLVSRTQGWEDVFAKLSEVLRDRWFKTLRQEFPKVQVEIREDAIQNVLARYWGQAQAGILLEGYAEKQGAVESYLSGFKTLKGAVLDAMAHHHRTKTLDACDDREEGTTDSDETPHVPASLTLRLTAAPSTLTSPWLTAVAHLYQTVGKQGPGADWAIPPHAQLLAQTRLQMTAHPRGEAACTMAMNKAHGEAQRAIQTEESRVREERADHHEGEVRLKQGAAETPQDRLWLVSQQRSRREASCDDQLVWIELRKKFHPLGTSQLTDLFGWTSAAAQQYCTRYRNAWPQIFPDFGARIQELYSAKGSNPPKSMQGKN